VVIAGLNRDYVTALLFPDVDACRSLCLELPPDATAEILAHPAVRARFQSLLTGLAAESTGSSNRVTRAILLEEPPSLDAGEITDKGSFNQRAVLDCRAALVEQLYLEDPPLSILRAQRK
jgi:feruloyl-CoA synthase